MRQHLAFYGNVAIPRVYCPECRQWALVLRGLRQCCDTAVTANPTKLKRISPPDEVRRLPKHKQAERLLDLWDHRCAYCLRTFGTWTTLHGRLLKVRLNWDHCVPWAFSQNNEGSNFLPACATCNGWKGSLVFQTLDEVRLYVYGKWQENA